MPPFCQALRLYIYYDYLLYGRLLISTFITMITFCLNMLILCIICIHYTALCIFMNNSNDWRDRCAY